MLMTDIKRMVRNIQGRGGGAGGKQGEKEQNVGRGGGGGCEKIWTNITVCWTFQTCV